jgi:probable rRNA maturation factor
MESAACMTVVEIDQSADVARPVDTAWLCNCLLRAVPLLRRPVDRIGMMLVGDLAMIDLHRRHHHIDQTTDVLTFELSGPSEAIDVDLAICVDEAARRAAELGHTVERELLLYALHGLLHCCGFDDHDNAAFAAMHTEEDRILNLIGVGATFRGSPHEGDQR